MDKLKGAKYFTKLDVCWGYNNVRIRKGDKWKAAFKTNKGLFEPTVMFFGMCNSPATLQAMMDDIFMTMIDNQLVIVYMDDILIFADTKEELEQITKLVLEELREHDLFLKAKKCEFCQTRIEYLGMIIKEGRISMDAVKLGGIRDWPIPTTLKQTRSFLGFGNFYRKFISHYSELARPLNDLTKKEKKFEWTTECQEAFDTMKKQFTEEPVLLMPDQSKPFQIESDTSKVATGTVLTQFDSNGDRHPVAFLSKTFSETERKYEIYNRELSGIIRALKEWRHYIQGSGHTMIVYSDHKNLTYFRTAQKLNDQQARWSLYLSGFNLKLIHLPGMKVVQSDALSRRPDYGTDERMEEEDKVVLPDNLFINLLDTELQEQISNGKELDLDVKNAIETLMKEGPTSLKNDLEDWKIEEIDGRKTIFFKGKNYIPKDLELRRDIVKMYHNHEMAGHPGELETYNGIRQNYWWPGLQTFVKNYVQGCSQQFKIKRSLSNPAYIAIEGANNTRPFAKCSMDLITDLPPMEGYDSILVVVDRGLLKGVILCPCAKKITWEGTVTLLRDNIFKRFGLPDEIISDRDPRFAAHAFQELLKLLNLKSNLTTAYYPQSDGATERVNQEIKAYLSIYCTSHPENWLHSLSTLEFTHNNRRHAEQIHSPFELIQGDNPISIPITFSHTKFPTIEEKMKQIISDREKALAAHELARTRIANWKQSKFVPFKKDQKVWLDTRNLKMNHHKKIAPKQEGPFEINEVLGPVTYRLKLPESWRIHNVFHAVLLRPYIENKVYGNNYPRPLPELLEGKEVYEVETILRHWRRGRGYQYYVKWKGYPITEATWEHASAFSSGGNMLKEYQERHQLQKPIGQLQDKGKKKE
jgi:RNase H-like domain found in reverse transcriptase/Reverse transcriptase (RNA-dependent DNA polymerase)/Integrase zinc binding domain/Chromo (CHRromatin Organisation MOdifier) domain